MLEAALKQDRWIVIAGLTLVTVLAWAWTISGAGMHAGGVMTGMEGMGHMLGAAAAWSASHALLMFLMWWIMMVAMMTPSAAPFVLLAAAIYRRTGGAGRPAVMAALLTAGYLVTWAAFSAVATLAQWGLESAGLLSAAHMTAAPALAAAILVGAGAYQLTPIRNACLTQCRSPVMFLAERWRPGAVGAARMGIAHGIVCVGCCWFLMALLFVGGVMNPLWVAGIALYVLLEKLAPWGGRLGRATGVLLIAGAVVLLARLI